MEAAVLVGMDGSTGSQKALNWAVNEARIRGCAIRLVMAVPPCYVTDPVVEAHYRAASERGARTVLKAAADRTDAAGIETEVHVVLGDPGGVLVEHSKTARLAVVGSRGRGGFRGRLLGSVSLGLAAHSHCPVLVIPRQSESPPELSGLATDFAGQVLAAIDAPSADHPALWEAAEVAHLDEKSLSLVMVQGRSGWFSSDSSPDQTVKQVSPELDAVAEAVRQRYPSVKVSWRLLRGKTAEVLVGATRTSHLLVMGTRGHGGFPGLLLGSVSQAVLQHGRSPMMVVPENAEPQ